MRQIAQGRLVRSCRCHLPMKCVRVPTKFVSGATRAGEDRGLKKRRH